MKYNIKRVYLDSGRILQTVGGKDFPTGIFIEFTIYNSLCYILQIHIILLLLHYFITYLL